MEYANTIIPPPVQPHPLQDVMEEIIEGLDDADRELYHLRYQQRLSIRAIAQAQGYMGHQIIQYRLGLLHHKIRKALEDLGITAENL